MPHSNPLQSDDFTEAASEIASKQVCKDCSREFPISAWERGFRAKFEFPDPVRCPSCRSRRRLLHLNQVYLTKRKCDATGKQIISNFPEDVPFPVYSPEYYFSDAFDGRTYGRPIDFTRSFFDQLRALKNSVPQVSLHIDYAFSENSEYTNFTGSLKNCYLVFNSNDDRDCLYSYGLDNSRSCLDCLRVQEAELCYEAIDCLRCYHSAFIEQCENCSDSFFLRNCIGCKNCFLCSNIRHKEYYFQNRPVDRETYSKLVEELQTSAGIHKHLQAFVDYQLNFPERFIYGVRNENVSGNYLVNSRNALECFDSHDLWDGMYATQAFASLRGFLDCDECGGGELVLESANSGPDAYSLRCCFASSFGVHDLAYCIECVYGCAYLFGCIGLRRSEYCVLNKQYSKEEYLALVPRLVEHMKATGEWGEFFPPSLSDFPYNHTQAQVHYPLTAMQARELGFSWNDNASGHVGPEAMEVPAGILESDDSVLKSTFRCSSCDRSYRLQPFELDWHRKFPLALPRRCFFCRHEARLAKRTPRQIFARTCDSCARPILTAYPTNHSKDVFCADCFAETVD